MIPYSIVIFSLIYHGLIVSIGPQEIRSEETPLIKEDKEDTVILFEEPLSPAAPSSPLPERHDALTLTDQFNIIKTSLQKTGFFIKDKDNWKLFFTQPLTTRFSGYANPVLVKFAQKKVASYSNRASLKPSLAAHLELLENFIKLSQAHDIQQREKNKKYIILSVSTLVTTTIIGVLSGKLLTP